ncbi:glycoside hydrolase family 92 protein [Favolaschia claudopus]|uniref:Glycoside hydrolase family 92 protein n=1 Tax=Favolaschia claudopus TaxID=2862362 RepID=A0AAW0DD96_9AGAR
MLRPRPYILSIFLLSFPAIFTAAQDPAQFVNPLIGTKNGGHVFSGATLPWGSVKAGADSNSNDGQAGYVSDGTPIFGLSSLHDDGTGGGKSLGNFPLLPLTSKECAGNDLTKCPLDRNSRSIDHGDPSASPGYFSIPLNNGVKAEVTVTHHAALYRFTYQPPSGSDQMMLLLEATGDLGQSFLGTGQLSVSPNPTTKGTRITGSGSFIPSFGQSKYSVYFCADTSAAFAQAKYYEGGFGGGTYTDLNQTAFKKDLVNAPAGVVMGFPSGKDNTLSVRMGVSWTSADKACAYAEAEVPDLSAFDSIHTAARAKWNEVLGTVEVDATGVSADTQQLFWTSLYRSYISPTNITGDNPLWNSTEPYWDSFYCIWDSFRTIHPLYAVTAPTAQAQIIRALIDVYRNTGWLPDCRMSLDKGFTQGGSNADSLLSDSFVKGIKEGIDWNVGLQAMRKDAEVPGDWQVQGRGGIASREKYGYVPVGDYMDDPPSEADHTRSASRLLEYAYNDFSIALVAQGLNNTPNTTHFFNKSNDWFNLWNPDVNHTGFKGFIQPRNADGSWFLNQAFDTGGVFRPDHCSPVYGHLDCFLGGGGEFYEASSWEYSFYVPHDMASLVQAMGGAETFSARLDTLFSAGFHDIGDEPGFLPTYLYNYVGQPAKTVDRVDAVLAEYYNTSLNGLPGNDDSGAMGAYAVWTHLGLYPVAGQNTYLISRPYFPKITIHNRATSESATTVTTILASGLSAQNKYIQSATLNGEAYTRNWIPHEVFSKGGNLTLVMGASRESTWGTGEGDLPMSLSMGGFGCGGGEECRGPKGVKVVGPRTVGDNGKAVAGGGGDGNGNGNGGGSRRRVMAWPLWITLFLLGRTFLMFM